MDDKRRSGGAPPVLQRVRGGQLAHGGAEITAAAAIAAGLGHQGSLVEDGTLRLLYLAAAAEATGALALESGQVRFQLHVKRGAVEHAASDARDAALGAFLLARGAVTREALADAERIRDQFGGDLVSALSTLRALDPSRAYGLLQEHGMAVVSRALAARDGTSRWEPGAKAPPSSFPLGSRWGILCEAVRQLDGATVRQLLGGRESRIAMRSRGRVDVGQLKLTAREARAAAWFDGRTSPLQLAAMHPPEAETILAVALLFAETELLAFGTPVAVPAAPGEQGRSSPPEAGRANARVPQPPVLGPVPAREAAPAPVPSTRPASAASSAPDFAALHAFQAQIATRDHFEVLGVRRDATVAQIKAAYFQLAKRYHPDAAVAGEPGELGKVRADIFARLGDAWRVLGNDADRGAYLRQLESGCATGGEVDISNILKAEEIFRRATSLVKARQYEHALAALDEATTLHPNEPEFSVWAAWARFLVASDRNAQHAASSETIESALKAVPRCMPGYLFLAQMARIMGDVGAAERHLKRGLAVDPDAPDLVRELKHLRAELHKR